MTQRPTVLIAIANDHWATNMPIPGFQLAAVRAWARLFHLPNCRPSIRKASRSLRQICPLSIFAADPHDLRWFCFGRIPAGTIRDLPGTRAYCSLSPWIRAGRDRERKPCFIFSIDLLREPLAAILLLL
jgi:hypothetical protein